MCEELTIPSCIFSHSHIQVNKHSHNVHFSKREPWCMPIQKYRRTHCHSPYNLDFVMYTAFSSTHTVSFMYSRFVSFFSIKLIATMMHFLPAFPLLSSWVQFFIQDYSRPKREKCHKRGKVDLVSSSQAHILQESGCGWLEEEAKMYHHQEAYVKKYHLPSKKCFRSFVMPCRHEWLTLVMKKMHYHNKTEWGRRMNTTHPRWCRCHVPEWGRVKI